MIGFLYCFREPACIMVWDFEVRKSVEKCAFTGGCVLGMWIEIFLGKEFSFVIFSARFIRGKIALVKVLI